MSPAPAPALEQALAARQSPGLFRRFRERPLPGDVALLLRIAANDSEACEQACAISGEPRQVVVEAAVLYIQQVMFHPESDSYRVFGVEVDAPEVQIREHRRWLLRWLHPDRNPDAWNAVYVNRVSVAWQDLRSIERRADYDARRPTQILTSSASQQSRALRQDRRLGRYDDQGLLSARAAKRLPFVVLGALALGSISMLGLEFYLKRMDVAEPLAAEVAAPLPAVIERPGRIEPLKSVEALELTEAAPTVAPTAPAAPPRNTAATKPVAAPVSVVARNVPTAPTAPHVPVAAPPSISEPDSASDMATVAPTTPKPLETRAALVPPTIIDDLLVAELVTQFRSAYASGKLDQMRGLLAEQSPDARIEQKAILDAYQRLFESSRSRGMDIRNVSWFAKGDVAVLIARYEAWIELRGDRKRHREAGDIRFDLRREGGSLRIARLRHTAKGS